MNLIVSQFLDDHTQQCNLCFDNFQAVLGLAIVLWISMYSTYWVCGKLYDYKCDIFNLFKKKKKKRKS